MDAERGRAGIRALQLGKLAASGAVIGAMLAVAVETGPRGGLSSAGMLAFVYTLDWMYRHRSEQ